MFFFIIRFVRSELDSPDKSGYPVRHWATEEGAVVVLRLYQGTGWPSVTRTCNIRETTARCAARQGRPREDKDEGVRELLSVRSGFVKPLEVSVTSKNIMFFHQLFLIYFILVKQIKPFYIKTVTFTVLDPTVCNNCSFEQRSA